ncbi:methionine ABC transporter ATP-binding protein [Actinokineospora spheciospongiae]|uniref:methionine ABC transporter ATP-binding protein n=1 Tax=Actinokineospora spheciospongiae TaxID=909613 RepID=UPI000D714C05|nr:methionine ABC transporter ATP-binding protein [Actinokineospora spheciospongiae]PWW66866.1 D-methionine transport system ATP-binding protein [Actinokineospora spheciospongiae]
MSPLIEFRGVTKSFGGPPVLDGIDLAVEAGEVFAVIGHSGAGKSTLVRLVNALEKVTSGSVLVDGVDLTTLSERGLREVRLGIGMVFQQFNLLRSRTVFGNVAYPLRVAGWAKADRERRVTELLHFVGLADKAWQYPDQLSGGQKQRVGIARALATNPRVLLADEATSALDPETTAEVLRLLKRVNTEFGVTIVVITHEMEVVREIADRVAVLESGRVVEHGTLHEVFTAPRERTTKRFVETVLRARPDADGLARLRERHPGTLVTAQVRDGSRVGAVLSDAGRHGVRFEVVHGGVKELGAASFGSLTLELVGADAGVAAVVAGLRAVTEVEELG